MIDIIVRNSGIIVLCIIGPVIVGMMIYLFIKSRCAKARAQDIRFYWDQFDDEDGCESARKFCIDGLHVHEHYGVPFPEGCKDAQAFINAAIASVTRRIQWAETHYKAEKAFVDGLIAEDKNSDELKEALEETNRQISFLYTDKKLLTQLLAEYPYVVLRDEAFALL